jgi:hypothetical protein
LSPPGRGPAGVVNLPIREPFSSPVLGGGREGNSKENDRPVSTPSGPPPSTGEEKSTLLYRMYEEQARTPKQRDLHRRVTFGWGINLAWYS